MPGKGAPIPDDFLPKQLDAGDVEHEACPHLGGSKVKGGFGDPTIMRSEWS